MSSLLEQRLYYRILDAIPGATPGLQMQVHLQGKKVCDISVGETYPYYDLASLTKIIFMVPALMLAFEKGLWTLETPVQKFWPDFPQKINFYQLLTHSSGAIWWQDLFKQINSDSSMLEKRQQLRTLLIKAPFENQNKAIYSDIGFMILGVLLEEIYQKPLWEVWNQIKTDLYQGLSTLQFHVENKAPEAVARYAPTERCPWRGRLIQGEVHDENTWSLGGVSSQAGLFASIDDLSWYGLLLRSQLLGISKTIFRLKTLKMFTSRALPLGVGDWALGFMMPSVGSASCGEYFSPHSIGHLGFTGTSVWYDPFPDILVSIVSNRVMLGRDIKNFAKLRPKIHNWVIEELKRV